MMELRIEQKAEELFFTYGLKSVTMDDIAREAGVSKKTIYQIFDDKNAVVTNVISKLISEQEKQLKQSSKTAENAVHEIKLISEGLASLVMKLRPVLIYDLHKYFPDCWGMMKRFKEENLRSAIIANLEKGIAEGLYRKDLDFETICQFGLVQFSSFFAPESYPSNKFKLIKVIIEITELVLYGIGSPKGLPLIKKHFENKHNEYQL